MWDSFNPKRNGDLICLNMVLIDEKETLIHATINKNLIPKFKEKLGEGSVVTLKYFKVVESSSCIFRPVSNALKIIILASTKLTNNLEDVLAIPAIGFEFVSPDVLSSRVNNNEVLSDVVGCLYYIGPMESAGIAMKRDIKIITNYSAHATITLWGEFGEKFTPHLYSDDGGPYVVILTCASVKRFSGQICFSTTNSSKIYVNLDTEYITSLREKFRNTSSGIEVVETSNSIPIEEEMFLNRTTVRELLACDWSPELQVHYVTLRGTITSINISEGWHFLSCLICKKKVKEVEGLYRCDPCNAVSKFPFLQYRIPIKVKDETELETTLVILNTVAEKLLDTTALKLLNASTTVAEKLLDTSAHKLVNASTPAGTSPTDDTPVQIQSLCKREFVFKLKLDSFNLKEGRENFTVSKLFPPDEQLELEYKINKEKKEKEQGGTIPPTDAMDRGKKAVEESSHDSEEFDEERAMGVITKRKQPNIVINDGNDNGGGDKNKLRK